MKRETPLKDFSCAINDVNSPLLIVSTTGTLLYANQASWIMLEYWKISVTDTLPAEWAEAVRNACNSSQTVYRVLSIGYVSLSLLFVPDLKNQHVLIIGADITQSRQIEKDLIIKAEVQSQAHEAIIVMDTEFRTLDVNPAYTRITGYSEADILGEPATFLAHVHQQKGLYERMRSSLENYGSWHGELWNKARNGRSFPVRISLSSVKVHSEEVTHYVAVMTDITTQKATEKRLFHMAHFDGLTGLPNREMFSEIIERTTVHANRTGEKFALMIVDLDGFKNVNDTFGHMEGDKLLQTVAKRMTAQLRKSDVVARFGGDEFLVLVRDLKSPSDAVSAARKILESISKPQVIDGYEVLITASIGVALFPEDYTEIKDLLRGADQAMYKTKRRGKADIHFYAKDMFNEAEARVQLQARLRRALDAGRIAVYYQPQISTAEKRVIGAEALARWIEDDGTVIMPNNFISIAEDSGLINPLGESVMRQACETGSAWRRMFSHPIRICVNVSVRQLLQRNFPALVKEILSATGFPAQELEIELTESIFIEDESEVSGALEALSAIGVRLSIDDFGTRYASLLYLKKFPIQRLKIDHAFLKDIPADYESGKIVDAIIAMGHSLGCEVIAEGVENEAQLTFLRERGCQQFQGFYNSPPVSVERFEHLMGFWDRASQITVRQAVEE